MNADVAQWLEHRAHIFLDYEIRDASSDASVTGKRGGRGFNKSFSLRKKRLRKEV